VPWSQLPAVVQQTPAIPLNGTEIDCINTALAQGRQIRVVNAGGLNLVQATGGYFSNASSLSSGGTNWFLLPSTATCATAVPSYYTSTSITSTSTSATVYETWYTIYSVGQDPVVRSTYKKPSVLKSVRNSIKRSLRLISNFGMEEDVRIFLGGKSIEVSHPSSMFKFVLSKSYNSLINNTQRPSHAIPYQLQLYTKSDVHIANLCVIMDKTPVLDQVLALAMYVRSGDEDEILRIANFSMRVKSPELLEAIVKDRPYLRKKLI